MKSESRLRELLSDRYTIERELGRGGMGRVYLARDRKHGRQVAIKVLSPELATGMGAERFLREIRTTARLSHPHIVGLHDSGDAEGVPYYIMPHIQGESLRDLLRRTGRLPVAEAIRLAREVAAALTYAHAHGVVHRDIKPDNILLAGGRHACVADFGLARALALATDTRLTGLGAALGSPAYMSPEQAGGERDVDARSDIYGLGCVLFEMLAGEPPFGGGDVRALLARHLTSPPPRLRNRRADVSPALEEIVLRCLEKDPDRRFQTADELEAALGALESRTSLPAADPAAEVDGPHRARRRPGKGLLIAGVSSAVVLLAVGVLWGNSSAGSFWPFSSEPLDDSRYAVLPFRADADVPDDVQADLRLWDELSRWDGIVAVDRLQLSDVLARHDGSLLGHDEGRDVARELSAGYFVRGEVQRFGDSLRINAGLYRTAGSRRALRSATVSLPVSGPALNTSMATLAQSLLFDRGSAPVLAGLGTRSVTAQQAFFDGRKALESWDLRLADSLFAVAARTDPEYSAAHLWLAQTELLLGRPQRDWRGAVERFASEVDRFPVRDRHLGEALAAMAREDYPAACEEYRALTARDPRDFVAWFGLGECHRRDWVVLLDDRSPSGARFRGSYHTAANAYRRAFMMVPYSFRGFQADAFDRVREFFVTDEDFMRTGQSRDGHIAYIALPDLVADSLSLVPYPWDQGRSEIRRPPTNFMAALRLQRQMFREVAEEWVSAFPDNPRAIEAFGLALQLLGHPDAITHFRAARDLSEDPSSRLRTHVRELALRLRSGLAGDEAELAAVASIADSLLSVHEATDAEAAEHLAFLAALRGRIHEAATLAARSKADNQRLGFPPSTHQLAERLLIFAAASGPRDSVHAVAARLDQNIKYVAADRRELAESLLFERAAALLAPDEVFEELDLRESTTPVLRAFASLQAGDTMAAAQVFHDLRAARQPIPAAALTVDVLLPEARVLARVSGPKTAMDWIDPTLRAVALMPVGHVESPARTIALLRLFDFRATLARRLQDTASEQRWRQPVAILWSDPDPFLRSTLSIP